MKKYNVIIAAIFSVIAFILLLGTIFHWKYKSKISETKQNRTISSYNLFKKLNLNNSTANLDIPLWTALIKNTFNNSPQLVFISLFNNRHEPIIMHTRLNTKHTTEAMNFSKNKNITKRKACNFSDNNNRDGFSYFIRLSKNITGNLLFLYDNNTYNQIKNSYIIRFILISLLIISLGLLIPLVISKVTLTKIKNKPKKEKIIKKEIMPAQFHDTSKINLEYLQERNSVLEKEIETLSGFRDISYSAASYNDCESLIDFIFSTIKTYMKVETVNIIIDSSHFINYFRETKKPINIISEKNQRRLLRIISNTTFTGKNKILLPLSANGIQFGFIKISSDNNFFNLTDVQKLALIIKQIEIPFYNFILYEIAVSDSLTGLYTRRHFNKRGNEELDRAIRYNEPLSLAIIDIDHFKKINDQHGHLAGDFVLKEISKLIRKSIRNTDYAFRYGGEEIVILMTETHIESSTEVMENLRNKIEKHLFVYNNNKTINVTASIGLTSYFGKNKKQISDLIYEADNALYFSKRNGRNKVTKHKIDINARILA